MTTPGRHGRRMPSDGPVAAVLLAPALILLSVFVVYPMFSSVHMSLYGGRRAAGAFVGLGNYAGLARDPEFWRALAVTGYYIAGTVPLMLGLSLVIALALRRVGRARGFFRTVFFLPYVTSVVAAAMVWRALFNPQSGPVSLIVRSIAGASPNWLLEPRGVLHLITGGWAPPDAGPSLALCCVMLFDIWHGCGFMVVVFLAGLCAIPSELEDAVRVDGAGPVRGFFAVTLPMLSPTVFFLFTVGCVRAFQAFNSFYALTQSDGNGGLDTRNMVLFIYTQFYSYGYWGRAAAAATLLTLVIMGFTLLQWRYLGRKVFYQ